MKFVPDERNGYPINILSGWTFIRMNIYINFYPDKVYPDEYLITILSGRTLSGWNFIRIYPNLSGWSLSGWRFIRLSFIRMKVYPDEVYPDEILSTRMKFYPDENLSGFIRPFLTSRKKIS